MIPLPENIPEKIDMPDAEVYLYNQAFSDPEVTRLFEQLVSTIAWRQDKIKLFGKEILQPRFSAWYGDPGKTYRYSGLRLDPLPWNPILLEIKIKVEGCVHYSFNSVLLNYYRHNQDSMGWHADNERELGPDPVIASVSLGASRRFCFRPVFRKEVPKVQVVLPSGSILLMKGSTQHFWQHQVPKTTLFTGPRINLTFRYIR